MADNYSAVYDAVRSRFCGDFLGAFERAVRGGFDFSYQRQHLQQEIYAVSHELQRPSAVYRPALFPDGNMWCALYGEGLMNGVAGFGETPAKAMAAFDEAWHNETVPVKREDAKRTEFDNSQFGAGA